MVIGCGWSNKAKGIATGAGAGGVAGAVIGNQFGNTAQTNMVKGVSRHIQNAVITYFDQNNLSQGLNGLAKVTGVLYWSLLGAGSSNSPYRQKTRGTKSQQFQDHFAIFKVEPA